MFSDTRVIRLCHALSNAKGVIRLHGLHALRVAQGVPPTAISLQVFHTPRTHAFSTTG